MERRKMHKTQRKSKVNFFKINLRMNAKIWSYSFSHLVKECLSTIILGQENGKTLQCHLSGKMEGNTLGLGRGVDQDDQNISKKMLEGTKRRSRWPNCLRRLGGCKVPWNTQIHYGRKTLM